MAQIPRPPKQGNTTTYVAKVAAGYTKILAGEVDADFDTIYNAWNSGADTANLKDGSVTGAKLAPGAVGPRELADGGVFTVALADLCVTTPKLANGAVTDAKVSNVGWAKITGAPTTLPPSGVAGGSLDGSYPNPGIRDGAIVTADLADSAVTSAKIAADAITSRELAPGTITPTELGPASVTTTVLQDGAVTHPKLGPGALVGNAQSIAVPPAFNFQNPSGTSAWVAVATLPAITVRGGFVSLMTAHGLGGGVADGATIELRWTRGGGLVVGNAFHAVGAIAFDVPLPSLAWMDFVAAGTYVYALEVRITGAGSVHGSGNSNCIILAWEIG